MRWKSRVLPAAAAALLVATSASFLPGCSTSGEHPVHFKEGAAVSVIVTYDPETKTATMSNKEIQLSFKHKNFAEWASPDGLVYVTFTRESPFDAPPRHDRKVLKSGPPKPGTVGRGFDYTAELELPDKTRVKVDPRIEIVP